MLIGVSSDSVQLPCSQKALNGKVPPGNPAHWLTEEVAEGQLMLAHHYRIEPGILVTALQCDDVRERSG